MLDKQKNTWNLLFHGEQSASRYKATHMQFLITCFSFEGDRRPPAAKEKWLSLSRSVTFHLQTYRKYRSSSAGEERKINMMNNVFYSILVYLEMVIYLGGKNDALTFILYSRMFSITMTSVMYGLMLTTIRYVGIIIIIDYRRWGDNDISVSITEVIIMKKKIYNFLIRHPIPKFLTKGRSKWQTILPFYSGVYWTFLTDVEPK